MVGHEIEKMVQTAIEGWTLLPQDSITDDAVIGADLLFDEEGIGDLVDELESEIGRRFSEGLDIVTLLKFTVVELKSLVVANVLGTN